MDFNFSDTIILENERVLLRPLAESDLEFLKAPALDDSSIFRYSLSQVKDEDSLKEYIETALKERAASFRYALIIFDKETGGYAGSTSFANISNKDQRLEIGWTWMGKQWQRSGLNRQCKFLLLRYAFEVLGFERVELKTDERNEQSRTAIQKIGGLQEGIFRSHSLMPDGFRRNTVYFSILKNEWPDVKHKLIS